MFISAIFGALAPYIHEWMETTRSLYWLFVVLLPFFVLNTVLLSYLLLIPSSIFCFFSFRYDYQRRKTIQDELSNIKDCILAINVGVQDGDKDSTPSNFSKISDNDKKLVYLLNFGIMLVSTLATWITIFTFTGLPFVLQVVLPILNLLLLVFAVVSLVKGYVCKESDVLDLGKANRCESLLEEFLAVAEYKLSSAFQQAYVGVCEKADKSVELLSNDGKKIAINSSGKVAFPPRKRHYQFLFALSVALITGLFMLFFNLPWVMIAIFTNLFGIIATIGWQHVTDIEYRNLTNEDLITKEDLDRICSDITPEQKETIIHLLRLKYNYMYKKMDQEWHIHYEKISWFLQFIYVAAPIFLLFHLLVPTLVWQMTPFFAFGASALLTIVAAYYYANILYRKHDNMFNFDLSYKLSVKPLINTLNVVDASVMTEVQLIESKSPKMEAVALIS